MMKALTYLKPGVIAWHSVQKPTIIDETDVIGKVVATTICGTDLHILKGDCPEVTELAAKNPSRGMIIGHEAIIEVERTGSNVLHFQPGDRCIVSCITSCGHCFYCKRNLQSHCSGNGGTSGWMLGHDIDGTQAEYVRIPYADTSLVKAPKSVPNESLLMLCDAIPTSYEIGVLNGNVKEGDSVAVVGMGPVGLAALLSAKILRPSQLIAIDMDDTRLEVAKRFGATHTYNPSKFTAQGLNNEILKATSNLVPGREPGVDVAIEAVGVPATFEMCQGLITSGGTIANVGVHGRSVELRLQDLWIKDCKITTGLVSAHSTKDLLKKVVDGTLDPSSIITHHFKFDEFEQAYDVFKRASTTKAIKVVLTP